MERPAHELRLATQPAQTTLTLPGTGYDADLGRLRTATGQRGLAVQAMKGAEAALGQQLSATGDVDRQVMEALRGAYRNTVEGRRRLDNLESEIVGAAQAWDVSTAAGAREFQRFLGAKLGEIIRVVEEADDDDFSKRALAAALTMLYAARTAGDDSGPADHNREPDDGAALPPDGSLPAVMADGDEDSYLDPLPADEGQAGYQAAPQHPSEVPTMPSIPGFGGESPGFGGMPSAIPAGLPMSGLQTSPWDDGTVDDGAFPAEDAAPAEETSGDDPGSGGPDDEAAAEASPDTGPVTVRLPDGATTTVADPRLAAVMQAAAEGTPVSEAFRRQGIDIAPPGTPVAAPVDQARLRPGDIGVFTDRHALAVGDGKALLDGQLHLVGNLRGPGFLGWQHPPIGTAEQPSTEPVPTRTAGLLRA